MTIRSLALIALLGIATVASAGPAARPEHPGAHAAAPSDTHATGQATSGAKAAAARDWARALEEGWPDTPAGRVASGWVRAFAMGGTTMREFLDAHLSRESLTSRPMQDRLQSYGKLHERLGDLMFSSVETSEPHELTVVLIGEDASPHRFVFTLDRESPHRLLKVGMLQHGHGHGHGSH